MMRDEFRMVWLSNVFWLALIIPVITIPLAFAGLYSCAHGIVQGESLKWKSFFNGIKKHFGASVLWTGANLLVLAVIIFYVWFFSVENSAARLSNLLVNVFLVIGLKKQIAIIQIQAGDIIAVRVHKQLLLQLALVVYRAGFYVNDRVELTASVFGVTVPIELPEIVFLALFNGDFDVDPVRTDKINRILQEIIDRHTDPWGIKVSAVEVKDVVLPEEMKRAMARQAESERERRAKIINAEGEEQAARKLVEAGDILVSSPNAMQLRYFAALHDVAGNRTSTIVFPVPMDLVSPFFDLVRGKQRDT